MKCRYCHNPDLVSNSPELTAYGNEEIIAFLESRKDKVDAVVLSGGEPTLCSGIVPFLERLRAMGFSIKLDTNGTSPQVIALLAEKKLTDYVAVDIKTSPSKYKELTGFSSFDKITATIEALKAFGVDFELRTTCVPGFGEKRDFEEIGAAIGYTKKYFLQQFVPSDELIDPMFGKLTPYSRGHIFSMKEVVTAFADECGVRGM